MGSGLLAQAANKLLASSEPFSPRVVTQQPVIRSARAHSTIGVSGRRPGRSLTSQILREYRSVIKLSISFSLFLLPPSIRSYELRCQKRTGWVFVSAVQSTKIVHPYYLWLAASATLPDEFTQRGERDAKRSDRSSCEEEDAEGNA